MKNCLLTVISLFVLGCVHAAGRNADGTASDWNDIHLKYGIEWGYTSTFLDNYHAIYFEPEVGYRIDRQGTDLFLYSNGNVYAKVGVELLKHYSLSILAGYAGVNQGIRLVPLTLRASYFMNSYSSDGVMLWGEGGCGFHKDSGVLSYIYKLGSGYRLKMSRKSSLDFLMSLQIAMDHPGIYNPEIPGYVPDLYVRRSDSIYGAVNFSLAINF